MRSQRKAARSGVVLGGVLAAMVSTGPMLGGTISLLIVPVSAEFGWGRSVFPLAVFAAAVAGALAAPLAGSAIDRAGARPVMLLGLAAFGMTHLLLARSSGGPDFFAAYAVLGAASSFSGTLGVSRLLSETFDVGRGRALGVTLGVGAGLGAALVPLVTSLAISTGGWRLAYAILGVVVWIVAAPPVWCLFPRHTSGTPTSVAAGRAGSIELGEALKTRDFWALAGLVVFNALAVGAISGHWAPLMMERGVSVATAAGLLSAFGLVKVGAQLGGGILLDRIQTPRIALLFLAPVAAGVAIFALADGAPAMTAAALLFGLGEGAELGLLPFLVGRYFGMRRFGEVMGWLLAANIPVSGLANVAMGMLFDVTGDYGAGLVGLCCAVTVAVIAAAALRPYRYAARK